MKNLAEYTIAELRARVGGKIRSLKTANTGVLVRVSDEPDREDYVLDMDWDDGNISRNVWHFWCVNVVFEELNEIYN